MASRCPKWFWIACLTGISWWIPVSVLSATAQSAAPSAPATQPAAEKSAKKSAEKSTEKPTPPSAQSKTEKSSKPPAKPSLKRLLVPGVMGLSVVGVGVGTVVLILRRSAIGQPSQQTRPLGTSTTPAPQAYIPLAQRAAATTPPAAVEPAVEPTGKPTVEPTTGATPTAAPETNHPIEPPTLESPTPQFPISTPQSPLPTPQSPLPTHPTPPLRLSKHNIVDTLLQELQQCDPQKRQKIIWELGQRGDSRAVQPLVDLLLDSDSRQQSLILSALSEIGTRTLKPMSRALALSLQNENADVRKNAIRDVTRIYDLVAQISQLLHSAAEDPDAEVQATAQWALGKVNRIKAAPPESLN